MTEKQKMQRLRKWIETLNQWEREGELTPVQATQAQAARSYLVVLQENFNESN
jgi:hypothetical protein